MNHTATLGLRALILATATLSLSAAEAGLSYQQFTFGTDGADRLTDGAVAPDKSIYLVGTTTGSYAALNAGGTDIVLMQMSPTGSILWSKQFETAGDWVRAKVTLAPDALYVQSTSQDPFTVAPGPATLSKFDLSGNLSWSRSLTSALASRPIVDAAGNVYVSGISQQTDQSPLNALVQKYDASGNLLWNRELASPANGRPTHTTLSRDGGLLVLGSMSPPAEGTSGIYIRKYDAGGAEVWTSELDNAGNFSPLGLTEDAQGNLRIGGNSNGDMIPPDGGGVLVSSTYRGRVIDTDAQGIQTRQRTVPISGSATSMAIDSAGRVYVAGTPSGEFGHPGPYVAIYGASLENSQSVLQEGSSADISAVAVGDPYDIYLLGDSYSPDLNWLDPTIINTDFAIIHLVPEPSSVLLLTGLATLTLAARRRRHAHPLPRS